MDHSGIRKIRCGLERSTEKSMVGIGEPDDPTFQGASVAVSSVFYIHNSFKVTD